MAPSLMFIEMPDPFALPGATAMHYYLYDPTNGAPVGWAIQPTPNGRILAGVTY